MKYVLGIFLLFLAFSCDEVTPRTQIIEEEDLTAGQVDSILTEFKFEYDSPIILDSSDRVLLPISTKLIERRTTYSSDGYFSDDFPRYWNVLFFDLNTGETQLLTEEKIRISRIFTSNDQELSGASKIMEDLILYEMGDVDLNKDGKLTSEDPKFLFSSNKQGERLTRVSPIDEDLQYFEVIPASDQILIRTLRDLNQDLEFDRKDQTVWYKAERIDQAWELGEIIDSVGRERIEKLYFDQWLRKK